MKAPISDCRLGDCMDFMREFPDKYFDLAIVDPPYGDNCNLKGGSSHSGKNGWSGKLAKTDIWNVEPDLIYFSELFRVSKNQIIWGANHFISKIPYDSSCWLVWDKGQRGFSLADGEMAWTSFSKAMRIKTYSRAEALQEGKIHPTQKPIALYSWLLENYAKPGDKILDTHLGSGSSRIAAYKKGFEFWGCEIDADYFAASEKRFREAVSMPLFDLPGTDPQQLEIF